ncbi:lytic transglycosylase domain-containing protein [Sphingomonas lutea]|uniref:Lytic transglycosylase domain-containing protein n=1 Tax=Sphingomonas lutea TaxID=1045317 RepID=A0A7G9SFT5_9SPHN|nr:lytic transglycosylase domain-containing protein [Sphingomonas lutea]QNN66710.1 lytic transglycosylase domain-containing protein [Sphingomonas lutea]
MSSVRRRAIILVSALVVGTASSAQYAPQYAARPQAPPTYSTAAVGYALNDWRRLRQSSGYSFGDYARFLNSNPDWPAETTMRRWAERQMRPGEHGSTVIAFFARNKPETGNGWARLADAHAAAGRMAEAMAAAREAWASPNLSATDEQAIWARYGSSMVTADHDRRADALLFAKKADDAARFAPMTSPNRRAAFAARVAMQQRSPNVDALYGAVIGSVTSDAGLMMDRARYLRETGRENYARDLAARPHNFTYRPADPERFYEMLLLLASGAAQDRQFNLAYNIARQVDDALPPGTTVSAQPLGVRDEYTSLAWLAGTTALDRIGQASNAIAMFDRYARGGRSLQVLTKGQYWAGRAALAAGRYAEANGYFQRAAAYPELFYGQLALERLGRSVTTPGASVASYAATPAQRSAFANNSLVQAVRILGQQGRSTEQSLFVRALAESLTNDADRGLAVDLSQQIRRNDLAVWISRAARTDGSMFYVRQSYPTLPATLSPNVWSLAHGITRQESSFDPYAQSHVGARGMMQLMPGTAREQAGKMGVGYDATRLYTDPAYNVMLGSAYFQRMLNMWDGNVPLAVASYNAGYGNVRKWVARYGDPRGNVDVLKWIEAIPFVETKGYVQRVIENSVVYDSMRSGSPQQASFHVSRYLGKSRPG